MKVAVCEHERGRALQVPAPVGGRFVHERLADVEHHDAQRHPATVSRSASEVTLSKRGSPSTTLTRPPAASTRPAQSVACNRLLLARAWRKRSAAKACGVCTAQRPSRDTVSCTPPSGPTRFNVSPTGRPGTAPSQPSESGASTRSTTSSDTSGRAASWTRTTSASAGTSARPARTESLLVSPPVTHAYTLPQPSSSATRIAGSSQPGGAPGKPPPPRIALRLPARHARVPLAAAPLPGDEDRSLLPARRRDEDDPVHPGTGLEPAQRFGEERLVSELRERLRPVQPEPL